MCEITERPSDSAAFGAKAQWAILTALKNAGPTGLPFGELKPAVQREFPDEPIYANSRKSVSNISAAIQGLKRMGCVAKVDSSPMSAEDRDKKRTRWMLLCDSTSVGTTPVELPEETPDRQQATDLNEDDLYEPTVVALEEQEICNFATVIAKPPLQKWEWGTPDVVGILRPAALVRVLNLPSEVVAVEVKLGAARHSLHVGCTQAANYKRFAHKVYLIVHPQEGKIPKWLKDQCRTFRIGLCVLELGEEGPTLRCIEEAPSDAPELRLLSDFVNKLPRNKRSNLRLD